METGETRGLPVNYCPDCGAAVAQEVRTEASIFG